MKATKRQSKRNQPQVVKVHSNNSEWLAKLQASIEGSK